MGVNLDSKAVVEPNSRGVLGRLGSDSGGLGAALGQGLKGIIDGIGNALRGLFDPLGLFAGIGQAAELFRDGQTALNDRTDLLNLDIGQLKVFFNRGCASVVESREYPAGWQKIPMGRVIGPYQGCELVNGGWRLDQPGCWNLFAQARIAGGYVSFTGDAEVEVRVYSPEGSLFSKITWTQMADAYSTATLARDVVVDRPGYRVELWIKRQIRLKVWGGDNNTFLLVQHQNRTIANGRGDVLDDSPDPDPPSGQSTGT